MSPVEYEKAVLERFRLDWPAPDFSVRHNVRLAGKDSRAYRQIDVAIYAAECPTKPIMIVEAKRHRRPIDLSRAGTTIGLVRDVGDIKSMMVATSGFSLAAANQLEAERIEHMTLTLTEAMALRWIPDIERRFAVNKKFATVSGTLVEALRLGTGQAFLMEFNIPFEEWCAVIETGLSINPATTTTVLRTIASDHLDDGHRFNAVRFLDETGVLDRNLVDYLLEHERDDDVREYLFAANGR